MEVKEGPLGPEVSVPGGFHGGQTGVVATLTAGAALWAGSIFLEGARTGDPWREAFGAGLTALLAFFMARPFGRAFGIVPERIQRRGDRLVLLDVVGERRVVPISDVVDVVYDVQTRAGPRGGGALTVAAPAEPVAPTREVPLKQDATHGRGVRLKLRDGEELPLGRGLDGPGSRRLMAVLRDRFGLPVRPD
jgi:hypothetical protein